MELYRYKARDRIGELVIGKLEGEDEESVIGQLDRLGYTVIEITPYGKVSFSLKEFFDSMKRIDRQEINIFTRQLATLIRAGLALAPSLTTICDQTVNKNLKYYLRISNSQFKGVQVFLKLSRSILKFFLSSLLVWLRLVKPEECLIWF